MARDRQDKAAGRCPSVVSGCVVSCRSRKGKCKAKGASRSRLRLWFLRLGFHAGLAPTRRAGRGWIDDIATLGVLSGWAKTSIIALGMHDMAVKSLF